MKALLVFPGLKIYKSMLFGRGDSSRRTFIYHFILVSDRTSGEEGSFLFLMSTFSFGATPDKATAGRYPVDRPDGTH